MAKICRAVGFARHSLRPRSNESTIIPRHSIDIFPVEIYFIFTSCPFCKTATESTLVLLTKLAMCLPEQQARRFVEHIDARRRQRHSCAITFQRAVRRFAARREAYLHRVSRREHAAARKLQSSVRLWLSGRQARQRTLLRQMGACALCCKRLAAVFFDATEQVDHKGGNKPWRRRKSGGWGSSILSAEGFREW